MTKYFLLFSCWTFIYRWSCKNRLYKLKNDMDKGQKQTFLTKTQQSKEKILLQKINIQSQLYIFIFNENYLQLSPVKINKTSKHFIHVFFEVSVKIRKKRWTRIKWENCCYWLIMNQCQSCHCPFIMSKKMKVEKKRELFREEKKWDRK